MSVPRCSYTSTPEVDISHLLKYAFKVPLIDDSPYAITILGSDNSVEMINHGMFTLWLKPFFSDPVRMPKVDSRGRLARHGYLSLLEAAEEVRKYYATLSF